MYLAHHSVELFLKGMILRKAPEETFTHDLGHLANRYHALYKSKKFKFNVPFSVTSAGVAEEEIALAQKFSRTRTERLRYPIDKNGKPWGGVHGFEPSSFLKTLTELDESYERIRSRVGA